MLNIDEDKLKLLLTSKKNKLERPKHSGVGEIISGFSIIVTLCLSDFNQVSIINPMYFKIVTWTIAVCILLFGVFLCIKSIVAYYSIESLYNEIADIDPNTEHPFNIILIKNNRESGKYLLFKSKRWGCWLFPNYHCLKGIYNNKNEILHIKECLERDLNISGNISIKYLGNEISYKYSVSDKVNKKYNFHYFQIDDIKIQLNYKRKFRFNGKKYCWKTLDQMYSSNNIVKKNQDVLDYVRKNCEIS